MRFEYVLHAFLMGPPQIFFDVARRVKVYAFAKIEIPPWLRNIVEIQRNGIHQEMSTGAFVTDYRNLLLGRFCYGEFAGQDESLVGTISIFEIICFSIIFE